MSNQIKYKNEQKILRQQKLGQKYNEDSITIDTTLNDDTIDSRAGKDMDNNTQLYRVGGLLRRGPIFGTWGYVKILFFPRTL